MVTACKILPDSSTAQAACSCKHSCGKMLAGWYAGKAYQPGIAVATTSATPMGSSGGRATKGVGATGGGGGGGAACIPYHHSLLTLSKKSDQDLMACCNEKGMADVNTCLLQGHMLHMLMSQQGLLKGWMQKYGQLASSLALPFLFFLSASQAAAASATWAS